MSGPAPAVDPAPPGSAPAVVASVVGSAVAVVALCLALRWVVVTSAGLEVSVAATAVTGALMGAIAAPPIRLPLERRDAAGHGTLIVLVGMLIAGSVVTVLGLGILSAATSAGCAAHAVQVRPTTRQMVRACTMVVLTSVASLGAQLGGWVDSIVDPVHTMMVMLGLLVTMCPLVVNAASISRRAAEAAELLDVERRRHVEVLEHTAQHDALTGLLSRRGVAVPLARAASPTRPGACSGVLFIDLDGFKAVNDVHGHGAGDALLQEVGRRLLQVIRAQDAAARTGGDEFIVVVADLADAGEAHALAARVQHRLESEVLLPDGSCVGVGASIGVALTDVSSTSDALLARADAAMYEAKRARRVAREALASPAQDD